MDSLFDKIKKDTKRGFEEGFAALKEGANAVSEKMSALTAEGKRQYKIFDLKAKIHTHMAELGGRAYDCLDSRKSPAADSKVKAVYGKIKKLEEQLSRLEGGKEKKDAAKKKPAAKANTTKKQTVRTATKKAPLKAIKKVPTKK